jgi:hypothetical protein
MDIGETRSNASKFPDIAKNIFDVIMDLVANSSNEILDYQGHKYDQESRDIIGNNADCHTCQRLTR